MLAIMMVAIYGKGDMSTQVRTKGNAEGHGGLVVGGPEPAGMHCCPGAAAPQQVKRGN